MYNEVIQNRIKELRRQMKTYEIDYYLVVTDDFHSSEYVADYFKCREYLSGFSGSNGDLLVWQEGAALWTDGRYFLQAEQQLEGTGISLMKMGEKNVPTVSEFLEKNMLPGQSLGFDGKTIRISLAKKYEETIKRVNEKACKDAEIPSASSIKWENCLVSNIWENRPQLPKNKAWLLDQKITGESRKTRLERVREEMRKMNANAVLFSSLDDIAWTLLLRGNDIEYNPVVLCYMLLLESEVILFADADKFDDDTRSRLSADGVTIKPYEDITKQLQNITSVLVNNGKILYDENKTTYALIEALKQGLKGDESRLINEKLPTILMKAVKTDAEIEGEKNAHIKDGVAITKLLYRLSKIRDDEEFITGKMTVTELDIAKLSLELRREQPGFIEESFAPIVATAEHGAIIHYEPTDESDKPIVKDAFLLMDTGAQYMDGTTDITRTVCMGTPSDKMKKHFTAVLKGHLALMNAVFPQGTTGPNLDILARKALWDLGLDYRHGTGHGVGFILNVHEGPQNINQKGIAGKLGTAFEAGMITSDEPGVYLEGEYGIRTENMILCEKAKESIYGEFLKFCPLTLVPYDSRSIDINMLNEDELMWLNVYNKKVWEKISPFLNEEEIAWLKAELQLIKAEGKRDV